MFYVLETTGAREEHRRLYDAVSAAVQRADSYAAHGCLELIGKITLTDPTGAAVNWARSYPEFIPWVNDATKGAHA